MSGGGKKPKVSGALAWMANNGVAANILMMVLFIGGAIMAGRVKQEVFPMFDLDLVTVSVIYPNASPSEVEQGVLLPVEEAVRGVDGVKEVQAIANEGMGLVLVQLMLGADAAKALSDVKSSVDRIPNLPKDAERPVVSLAAYRNENLSLILYGDQSESVLREYGEKIRSDLLQKDGITSVDIQGTRPLEIAIEVPEAKLRRYGLTLDEVARAIRGASMDVPGGVLKTKGGEVLVRTKGRRYNGDEFRDIVVRSRPDGSQLKVGDIANVTDGFREVDQFASFNGQRAVKIRVFRVGDQKPMDISRTVRKYIKQREKTLPPGMKFAIWADTSEMYRDRVDLLRRNAIAGLILVMISLSLFLDIKLAFWVTLGIPISFAGSMLFLPVADVSVNMISLFAFIVTLGMVVDDAIVVGEAIYHHKTQGTPSLEAAIKGVKEVATPVIFSVTTSCVAFSPMLFVPGPMGKFFRNMPIVVISVLMVSLLEGLFILPAHLAHTEPFSETGVFGFVQKAQQRFSRLVEFGIQKFYAPVLRLAVRFRYVTLAMGGAIFMLAVGLLAGGLLKFSFLPAIEADIVTAQLTMPFGTSAETTLAVEKKLLAEADRITKELNGGKEGRRGTFALMGSFGTVNRQGTSGISTAGGSHLAEVSLQLKTGKQRTFSAKDLAERWRKSMSDVPGIESLSFIYSTAAGGGKPIDFELSHDRIDVLEKASTKLSGIVRPFVGIRDLDDGFSIGKEQLDLKLRPDARAMGLNEAMLAAQIRNAFFGAEAVRQQRGRDELRVYVRRPKNERISLHYLESFLVRTPTGGEMPLGQAAEIRRGRAYTQISRVDGRRVVHVSADIGAEGNANEVTQKVMNDIKPKLEREYPGLRIRLGGEQKSQAETNEALALGGMMALIVMYALMAVPFKSYLQPIVIMTAIPFGFVGAVLGHILMGFNLSMISMMGLVALAGVAVNDSLVLVSAINDYRRAGHPIREAVVMSGTRRFRPILLTSLTTFLGLMPMLIERSVQARFLIPMAISLGFGVLFSTFITLLLVPALYRILDDNIFWMRIVLKVLTFGMLEEPDFNLTEAPESSDVDGPPPGSGGPNGDKEPAVAPVLQPEGAE